MLTSRLLALAAFVVVGLSLLACDVLPDECELDDNVCEGNVANICYRPGPESRLRTKREDCGAERTCVAAARGSENGSAMCARKGAPSCAVEGERACVGNALGTCTSLGDGRLVWVDYACPASCSDRGSGPGCY